MGWGCRQLFVCLTPSYSKKGSEIMYVRTYTLVDFYVVYNRFWKFSKRSFGNGYLFSIDVFGRVYDYVGSTYSSNVVFGSYAVVVHSSGSSLPENFRMTNGVDCVSTWCVPELGVPKRVTNDCMPLLTRPQISHPMTDVFKLSHYYSSNTAPLSTNRLWNYRSTSVPNWKCT